MLSSFFWFKLQGEITSYTRWGFIILLLLFVAYLIYFRINRVALKKSTYRRVYRAGASFAWLNLFFGLYLWFVMEQAVPILSVRAWLLFWAAEMFLWLANVYKGYKRCLVKITGTDNNKEISRYIP